MVPSIFSELPGQLRVQRNQSVKAFFSQGTTESGKTWTHRQARTAKYDVVSTAGVQSFVRACSVKEEQIVEAPH